MFWIISGKPGSGKTSHALDFVLHDRRFKTEQGSDRPVYYRGIPGLQLPWHELTDEETENWHEHLPVGAVLVVDEAQEIWRGRPPSRPVPPGLIALEKHRHSGWDIIFISQDPSLLDQHARKICNEHFHYSRPFGAPFAIQYHAGSGYVDPSNKSALAGTVQTKKGLPKRVFGLYKSAEVHTHKFRPPKMIYVLPVLAVLAGLLFWRFLVNFGGGPDPDLISESSHQQAELVQTVGHSRGLEPAKQSWVELLAPEIESLPYTAPLYDDLARTPRSVPVVHGCMSMHADYRDCRCYTQQGTRIHGIPVGMCRSIIEDGMFNHLAREEGAGARSGTGDVEARDTPGRSAQTSL